MAKKYMSDIHLEDYAAEYEAKKTGYRDMVFTGGRQSFSLNGAWNYAVDQCGNQYWLDNAGVIVYYRNVDGAEGYMYA